MEIIMKVKCSPNPGAGPSSTHSSLKIVDHHRQLQQHTGGSYNKTNTPPQITTYIPPPSSNTECPLSASSCSECTVGYCCNLQSCCVTTPPISHQALPTPPPLLPLRSDPYTSISISHQQQTTEDQPEFVSIDDEKVKQYLMKFGQQHLAQQQQQQRTRAYQDETKVTRVYTAPSAERTRPIVYEIIELDDEGEREKLKQIKQQAEQNLAIKKSIPCIDINYAARHTKSLNISLIPKTTESQSCQQQTSSLTISHQSKSLPCNQKIIAEINLIDSSDDDSSMDDCEDEDDDTLPLAAVSCELECDDDDDNSNSFLQKPSSYTNFQLSNPHTIIQSKRSEINAGSNNEHLLVRWEEYEGQRERVFFECFLCGKKVQSSYNLRRHMMIHTGERPFACDMCDRRFREFSDLKKHRRRHSSEPNFICMVCRELPPVENDPTRCIKCCTQSKNAVLVAAMKRTEEEENNRTPELDIQQCVTDTTTLPSTPPTPPTPPTPSTSSAAICPPTTKTVMYAAATAAQSPGETTTTPTQSSGNNSANSEDTQRLLDNIPAVHRPGFNQLGMITRKEFPCPLCNRAFGTRHNLKRHYMIHTGEKPFSCTKCRKPFREYSTLKKHMVTHQRDRWYKCMQCPLKFRDFLKYTEHKESHPHDDDDVTDEHPEGSPSKSQNKYQSSDSYMDSNDEDSISDDWLECCECGQRFNEIDAYNEHLKEHDSSSPIYQCYICKDRFETRTALEKHLEKHKPDTDSDGDIME